MDQGDKSQPVSPSLKMTRSYFLSGSIAFLILLGGVGGVAFNHRIVTSDAGKVENAAIATSTSETATTTAEIVKIPPATSHVAMPDEVRGMYWTAWTASTLRVGALLAYASSSHLNTIVLDVKLDNGELAFVPNDPALAESAPKSPVIEDLDALLRKLKDRGIYRIARIAVMRDDAFGKLHPDTALRTGDGRVWRDKSGLAWLDPAAPQVAKNTIALAHEVYARGFDEVQFDYVRFASDGRLSAIRYPVYDGKKTKNEVMQEFFRHVGGDLLTAGIPVSFDLFGLTFVAEDGLNIGQRLPDVYPFADAVSPMVYPSHYAKGFEGFANPALYPYEVVKRTLDKGTDMMKGSEPQMDEKRIRSKFRPWIQDFNLGAAYDVSKVRAQIKASRDAGAAGWLLWNPRNVYTSMDYLR